ncbi:MAG: response regulator, partial [Planctomycetota bacterium]
RLRAAGQPGTGGAMTVAGTMTAAAALPAARSDAELREILASRHRLGDRVVRCALLAHFLIALGLAGFYDTWAITLSVSTVALGMFLVGALLLPGSFLTRCIAGISLQTFCALHIYQLHGLPEMHFFFFTGFTLMIVYGDWRPMWPGALLIIAQHIVFAILTNSGIDVAFFPEAYVSATKLSFHFGIALVHVVICGYFAHLQRQHTLAEADRRQHINALAAVAEEANRSKSAFLASMSHEIRTPLGAILGYADLLLEPDTDAAGREDGARTIQRNGRHLLAVIDDILDLSKIEAGKLEVELLPCAPRQLVAEAIEALRVRAAVKGLQLQAVCTGPIPERIATDPTRLRQILLNLGGNAIKFTERGSVTFEVSCRVAKGGDTGHLVVAVADTGIGLDATQAARLFAPFQQADVSTTRRFGGTGLGLVISKRLAQALGGDITLHAERGTGCRFEVTIGTGPLAGVPFDDRAIAISAAPAPAATGRSIRLRGRVLLAEDGPDNQRLLTRLLERAGAAVEVANNGRAAVELAQAARAAGKPHDLILMDMQMPELDGYEATRALRDVGLTVPIVAVTAHAMKGARERCLAVGCDDYLTKPVDRAAMLAVCQRLLATPRPS